jgi:hypothetical protein
MPIFGTQPGAGRLISPNKKPDRYAAAICIRVRPDLLLRGYSVGESCGLSVLQRA